MVRNVAARLARAAAVASLLMVAGGCAFYVDDSLHDLSAAEKVSVAKPQPVQLLFDFQTKGVHNGAAADQVKGWVLSAVQDSGLFSQVSDGPVPNGAVLSVVINNVPLGDDANKAYEKGFVTGATLGLVGNTVGDGYICTIDFLPGPGATKITRSMHDAIYASIGVTAGTPQHAQKVSSIKDAVQTMTRQVVSNTLNELAKDKAFAGPATVAWR